MNEDITQVATACGRLNAMFPLIVVVMPSLETDASSLSTTVVIARVFSHSSIFSHIK